MSSYSFPCFVLAIWAFSSLHIFCNGDPTDGFTAVNLNEANFVKQKPYDVPLEKRYSFVGGVRKLWVHSTDEPFSRGSPTKPRTEIRMSGYDYSSGIWQFEGYGYVPSGTSGVSIMQVFGGEAGHATTLMLWVIKGTLMYYDSRLVEENIYDRWFRVNVIHNVDEKKVTVFIDGTKKLDIADHGGDKHYFKFGVYTQKNSSNCMESHWKDVRILTKNAGTILFESVGMH